MKALVFRLRVSVTLGRNRPHSDLSLCWQQEDTAKLQAPSWEAVEESITRGRSGFPQPLLTPLAPWEQVWAVVFSPWEKLRVQNRK